MLEKIRQLAVVCLCVCVLAVSSAVQAAPTLPTTVAADIDDIMDTFSGYYFPAFVGALSLGAVALAVTAAWSRIRRHAK